MKSFTDLLWTDLRASTQSVNRLMMGGILFVILCHFFILEPYFYHRTAERKIAGEIDQKTEQKEKLSRGAAKIAAANTRASRELNLIRERIKDYPDHLRGQLSVIRDRANNPPPSFSQRAPRRVGDFVMPAAITNFEAGVRWYIKTWFSRLVTDLNNDVVTPIIELEESPTTALGDRLKRSTAEGIEEINTYLNKVEPDFWRSYSGKGEVAGELLQVVEKVFAPVEAAVSDRLKETQAKVDANTAEMSDLQARLETTKQLRVELEARLDALESPVGRIPVGLTDLIKLYPVLIVVFVVMLTLGVQKSVRLHLAFWREFTKLKEGNKAEFPWFTDCWFLPPYRSMMPVLTLVFSALFVATLFGRAGLMIMAEPQIFVSGTADSGFPQRELFKALYLAGTIVICACLILTVRGIRGAARSEQGFFVTPEGLMNPKN